MKDGKKRRKRPQADLSSPRMTTEPEKPLLILEPNGPKYRPIAPSWRRDVAKVTVLRLPHQQCAKSSTRPMRLKPEPRHPKKPNQNARSFH